MQNRTARSVAYLRFFAELWRVGLYASLALRGAFALRVAFMAANNLIYFVFWGLLFARVPHVRGYGLAQTSLVYGVLCCGVGLSVTLWGGMHQLARMIEEGELDVILAQPKPALPYALGMRCQASGFGDMLSGLVLIFSLGELPLSQAPLAALCCACSAIVFTATAVIVYSSAFWLGRNDSVTRQLVDSMILFGSYPDRLFDGGLRLLLFTLIPAGFVSFVPARLLFAASLSEAALLGLATLGYALTAFWVFGRGLARYSSGSRFGTFG